MITEDYVSYEVAKLLKEKGFKGNCIMNYINNELMNVYDNDYPSMYELENTGDDVVDAPTLQMAMKWLREVHNIGIFPSTYTHIADRKTIHSYGTAIINLKTYELMTDNYLSNDTYEDAVEAAIKYCLENLI